MRWWTRGYEPNRFVVITYNSYGNIIPLGASEDKDVAEKFKIEQSDKYKGIEIKEVESLANDESAFGNNEPLCKLNIYLLTAIDKDGKEVIVISSINVERLERYIENEFTKTQREHYDLNIISIKVAKVIDKDANLRLMGMRRTKL